MKRKTFDGLGLTVTDTKKTMMKYWIEIQTNGMSRVHWSKIYNKSTKEIDAEIEKGIKKGIADEVIKGLIDSNDNYLDLIDFDHTNSTNSDVKIYLPETFYIQVSDYRGIVFKSDNPKVVHQVPIINGNQYPGDGTYLIEVANYGWWHWMRGDFETEDKFKPSKLQISRNQNLEYIMDKANVDFNTLRYGNQYIDLKVEDNPLVPVHHYYKAKLASRHCKIERIEF